LGLSAPSRLRRPTQARGYAPAVGFNESNLHRDERIVLDLHPHWIMLVKGVVLLVAMVVVGVWVLVGWEIGNDTTRTVVNIITALAVLAALLYFLQRWITWTSTNFVVTTDRTIYREGVVSKRGIEIPHDRINTVFFDQGVVDRFMRSGTLTIESAGENGVQVFENVQDPVAVQQALYQEMEDNENRKFDRVRGPAGPTSVADELAKLAALRDQGHLSDAEFQAQKARLLHQ
jgi:uncharacterized membrane protein YdbT with pleckstrin-like domain